MRKLPVVVGALALTAAVGASAWWHWRTSTGGPCTAPSVEAAMLADFRADPVQSVDPQATPQDEYVIRYCDAIRHEEVARPHTERARSTSLQRIYSIRAGADPRRVFDEYAGAAASGGWLLTGQQLGADHPLVASYCRERYGVQASLFMTLAGPHAVGPISIAFSSDYSAQPCATGPPETIVLLGRVGR